MRTSFLLFALAAVACGPTPYYVIRAPAEPAPATTAAGDAPLTTTQNGAPAELLVADSPLVAEVVPGLERIERIADVDGALCGARTALSPICSRAAATSDAFLGVEALKAAKRFEVISGMSCSILESGRLTCEPSPINSFLLADEPPARRARFKRPSPFATDGSALDFKMASADDIAVLSSNGTVTEILRGEDKPTRLVQFKNAVEISLAGPSDQLLCARSRAGAITCVRAGSLGSAPENITGIEGEAAQLERGFARTRDGSVWSFGLDGARAPSSALRVVLEDGSPLRARELASTALLCFLTPEGSAQCADLARTHELGRIATRTVTLPGAAKTFRPAGAPCVELASGLVACWGDELGRLRELGREVLLRTPGALEPRR